MWVLPISIFEQRWCTKWWVIIEEVHSDTYWISHPHRQCIIMWALKCPKAVRSHPYKHRQTPKQFRGGAHNLLQCLSRMNLYPFHNIWTLTNPKAMQTKSIPTICVCLSQFLYTQTLRNPKAVHQMKSTQSAQRVRLILHSNRGASKL